MGFTTTYNLLENYMDTNLHGHPKNLSRSSSAYSIGTPKGSLWLSAPVTSFFQGRFLLLNFGGSNTTWQTWATIQSQPSWKISFLGRGGHVQGVSELKSLQPSWTLKCPKNYEASKKSLQPNPLSRNLLRTEVKKKNMCEDWSFVDPLQLHQFPLEVKSAIKLIVHNFWDPKNPLTLQWKGDWT